MIIIVHLMMLIPTYIFSMNLYILLMEVAIIALNSPLVKYWISILVIFVVMVHSLLFTWTSEA